MTTHSAYPHGAVAGSDTQRQAHPQSRLAAASRPRRATSKSAADSSMTNSKTLPVVAIGTCPVVAIGDVHGCASLLQQELEKHESSGAELILLGDLIDRSPERNGDRQVIELVLQLQRNPSLWGLVGVTVLRGNHEQMLLGALEEDEPKAATEVWEWNGGDPDLLPFYRQHRAWFAALPHTAIRGAYLFVHAGVRPGVPLEQQKNDDLIWIRRPFLTRSHGLPYTVVHGHSITKDHRIDRRLDRINLDTGAFESGVLSSLSLGLCSDLTHQLDAHVA
jgi:serine/threonine protein phosphatase 1